MKDTLRECERLANNIPTIGMDVDRETEMNLSPREICVLLLHQFLLGHKATEAKNNICQTMGQDIISTRTAERWFNRFNNKNYELDDSSLSGRSVEVDLNQLKQLIEDDRGLSPRCLAEHLGCSHTIAETYRFSGKFMQLISKCISGTFGFSHSIEGGLLLRYTNFGPIGSFLS